MKKIFVLILVLSLIIINAFYWRKNFSFRDYFSSGNLTQYTANLKPYTPKLFRKFLSNKKDVVGESIYFENLEVGEALKTLQAEVKYTEYLEDMNLTVLYCYTDKIKDSVYTNNYKINLQIASCENYTVIGWPMILGSF